MPTLVLNPSADTYIASNAAAVNYGALPTFLVGNNKIINPLPAPPTYEIWKGLLKFDLSAIPLNAYVFSASLSIYDLGTDLSSDLPVSIYSILQNWIELQATWNERTTGVSWSGAGCSVDNADYNPNPITTQTISFATVQWYNFNVAYQAQNWIWGTSNYGFLLANLSPSLFFGPNKEFYSRNFGTPASRPKLTIVYELAANIPTLTSEPTYTKGISNTITWSDESSSGALEYYPQASSSSNFATGIKNLSNIQRVEYIAPTTYNQVETFYSIGQITGVFLNSSQTGTNYYSPGIFTKNVINLGVNIPSITTLIQTGTGLSDIQATGNYTGGSTRRTYVVKISTNGTPDKFDWSDDGGNTWTTTVNITGAPQSLSHGISITFASTTGHTIGNYWTFFGQVKPVYVFYITNGWVPARTTATFEDLIDGTKYYYRVKSRNILLAESNWSNIVFSTQDNGINLLTLISPNGTEVWDGGFNKVVQWIADDDSTTTKGSSGLTTDAIVYHSVDSGTNWTQLATSPNYNNVYQEAQTSITDRRVYTEYYIYDVYGVWLSTDPMVIGTATFTGTGLNDLATSGTYTANNTRTYRIKIDSVGGTDTFSWSDSNGVSWNATGVAITGGIQALNNGVRITFGAVTGHTLSDYWRFTTGHLGINYYYNSTTNQYGSFDRREITLVTPLATDTTDVVIEYATYGKYTWTLPINQDSTTTRIKVKVTDNVGNEAEDYSDKDFTVITIKNRLHDSVYDTSPGSNINNLMKTYAYNNQQISHGTDNVKRGYTINHAENTDLDLQGYGYGVLRDTDENDEDYRVRIINSLSALKNTRQAILDCVAPYTTRAWIYEWMGDWEHDYCFYLDWSFLDYRDYISGGMIPGREGMPYTFELHVIPKQIKRIELVDVTTTSSLYTDYPILYLDGVFANEDLSGTNYYLPKPPGNFSVGPAVFTGVGLNDMTSGGYYLLGTTKTYRVEIDSLGAVDTFKWSNNNGVNWVQSGVSIIPGGQVLSFGTVADNVYITFAAVNGHSMGDYWSFELNNRLISLGTLLATSQTEVYVSYTPQTVLRKIADAVLRTRPAGVLPYIILHLGGYYGENLYAQIIYGS